MNKVSQDELTCTCEPTGQHCFLCLYGEHAAREILALQARVQALEQAEKDTADKYTAESLSHDVTKQQLTDMTARKDAAYLERNQVVAALAQCFPSGTRTTAIDGWSDDWHGCVYIDLPTGQASWHFHDSQAHLFNGLPEYTSPWDGHTTEDKYARLSRLTIHNEAIHRPHTESKQRDQEEADAHATIAQQQRLLTALERRHALVQEEFTALKNREGDTTNLLRRHLAQLQECLQYYANTAIGARAVEALHQIQHTVTPSHPDSELLNALRDNSWDLRCVEAPTGGGDSDIGWIVIEHHMSAPTERIIGRSLRDEPREAIEDALNQPEA